MIRGFISGVHGQPFDGKFLSVTCLQVQDPIQRIHHSMKYFFLLGLFACSSLHAETALKTAPTELGKVTTEMANAANALIAALNKEQDAALKVQE